MALQRFVLPAALLVAGTLLCDVTSAENGRRTSRRAASTGHPQLKLLVERSRNPFARKTRSQSGVQKLAGRRRPQRAAKQYQLKPERFKVKEPPRWVPQTRLPGFSARPQPFQAMKYNIKPERYKVKEPPTWVPQRAFPNAKRIALRPDLLVKQYIFGSKKIVRVRVANIGRVAAGASKLRLTVRRINGTPVGRMTTVVVPAIPAGSSKWVSVNATNILPNAVALQSTTFRLDADSTKVIAESKETNNTRWHNLP